MPPPDCFPARYGVLYHGVGLADEYPTLPHASDWTDDTPDGVLEPGMVLCVESYIGRLGGREGVKIEEQVLITETGSEKAVELPARRPSAGRLTSDRLQNLDQLFDDLWRRVPRGDHRQALAQAGPADDLHFAAFGSWRFATCQERQSIAATSALPSATAMIEARCAPVSMRSEKMSRLSPIASRSRVGARMPDMESRTVEGEALAADKVQRNDGSAVARMRLIRPLPSRITMALE